MRLKVFDVLTFQCETYIFNVTKFRLFSWFISTIYVLVLYKFSEMNQLAEAF